MRIAHIAPFAPARCGLYESARDFVRADCLAGGDAWFVDRGIAINSESEPPVADPVDDRGGWLLPVRGRESLVQADVIVEHMSPPPEWDMPAETPIVWIQHGRPAATFRPEQADPARSHYSRLIEVANFPQVKAVVTMWPEHMPYWAPILPREKLFQLPAPPICGDKFSADGEAQDFGDLAGKQNVVIATAWRDDIDIFDIFHAAICYARDNPDAATFHFYSMNLDADNGIPPVWVKLLNALNQYGALGHRIARHGDMAQVYRAADLILSPHRICTRVVGEALLCGTPVVAALGNDYANWTYPIDDPEEGGRTLAQALQHIADPTDSLEIHDDVAAQAARFSLDVSGIAMAGIYKLATGG